MDNNLDTSAIDAQIKQAQDRKAMQGNTDEGESAPRKRGRRRLSDEERAERDEAKAKEKARKAEERAAARAAKQAEREANKKPAHMAKVEKALAKLPVLGEVTQRLFDEATGVGLSLMELEALSAHLSTHVRLERTKAALERTLTAGQAVRIIGGDPRYVGQIGTVEKPQRIRCYVSVPGVDKSIYLFTSDVEPVEGEVLVSEETQNGEQEVYLEDGSSEDSQDVQTA